jgi:hypothetical protein
MNLRDGLLGFWLELTAIQLLLVALSGNYLTNLKFKSRFRNSSRV